ncbi:MAG: hypothetical protein COB04_08295 [Gammaproteobacteria bacterium]|nr:MAG: hypothetical protein COB04_08295 [Gammaproteobacteria bacterium]
MGERLLSLLCFIKTHTLLPLNLYDTYYSISINAGQAPGIPNPIHINMLWKYKALENNYPDKPKAAPYQQPIS